jgi:FixJ family two-component response regulator
MIPSPTIIIIIDDDAAICEAVGSLIRSSGFHVLSFASAEDFLDVASPDGIGCLILDINLPGMSGLELQRHLAPTEWRHVPVIFITARDDHDGRMRTQAIQAGAHAFLSKSFFGDELLDALKSAIHS